MTSPFCQLRILVAESDSATQSAMGRALAGMGVAVIFASNGKEALAKFAADHFDLIFMGLEMPEMDGFAASAAIRHHESALHDDDRVPIIALTALAGSREREHCFAAGMDSYLEKPASPYQLQIVLLSFANPDSLRPSRPPLKWSRMIALERVGGDENLLSELVAIFYQEKSRLLGQMERALYECKPELLRQAANDLQEQLTYLGISEVSETARKLGVTASQINFPKAAAIAGLLRTQLSATDATMHNH